MTMRVEPATDATEHLAWSAVWALLSQALAYPTPAAVDQLLGEDLPFATAFGSVLPPPVAETLAALPGAFDGLGAEQLEVEHRRLFSHVHSADCPPFETDYTARDVWRQSEQLADLAGFFRAFGVEPELERPDHVSVELEFVHVLLYKAAWAAGGGDADHEALCLRALASFFRDHVVRWFPSFAERLAVLGADGPYAAIAQLATAAVHAQAEGLGLEIPVPTEPIAPTGDAAAMGEKGLCEG